MKDDILILGAGPAGMAAALELSKAKKQFTLVEKAEQVGGLAKTYQFGAFRTDNGPHRFFSKNKYLYEFIQDLLGEKWIKVTRFTRFYINGKFYQYPVEWKNALLTMGPWLAARVFTDYLLQRIRPHRNKAANFEEYVVKCFGRTLAEFNMLNYTEKIWGTPCSQLSADWAEQRIRGLSIMNILINSVFRRGGPKTLVDEFYFPDQGSGLIYEAIKGRVAEENDILLKTEPIEVTHDGKRILNVTLNSGRHIAPKQLVSSVPITVFVKLLKPAPPEEVLRAASQLKFRSQVYLFITIKKPSVSKDQWIYFPNKNIPFGRISEMKNFSQKMSPPDKTSLFVEFFCWENDKIWNMSQDDLFRLTIDWLEKMQLVKKDEVENIHHIKQTNVYPVYDLSYKENLKVILDYLDRFENLIMIGRPGRFKYTNQDHSLEMGILAARSIVENRRMNIEDVGDEKEYFEKGYVR